MKIIVVSSDNGISTAVANQFTALDNKVLREFTILVNEDIKPTVSITYKPERDVIVSITPTNQTM